jgi:hypothetical protein
MPVADCLRSPSTAGPDAGAVAGTAGPYLLVSIFDTRMFWFLDFGSWAFILGPLFLDFCYKAFVLKGLCLRGSPKKKCNTLAALWRTPHTGVLELKLLI